MIWIKKGKNLPMIIRVWLTALLVFNFLYMSYTTFPQTNIHLHEYDINFENFNTGTGLSSPIVRCILQDKIGFLWFGTYNGLDRYDGLEFKSFRHIPGDSSSLTNGFVQCIFEDKSNNLWIGTTNGLDKYDRLNETFTHFKPFKNIAPLEWNKNNVHSITGDMKGFIWIGTAGGLLRFDPLNQQFKHFKNDPIDTNTLRHNVVYALLMDKDNNLWIGTGNGLDRFNPESGTFDHVWHDSIYRSGFYKDWIKSKNWITALYEDEDNEIWAGTQGGLLEMNCKSKIFTLYEYDPKDETTISFYGVTSIHHEDMEGLWVGTWNGLNYFDKRQKKFMRLYHNSKNPKSLSYNSISSILRERSGTLWISTYGGGVSKVNRTKYPYKKYSQQSWKEIKLFSSASIMHMSNARDGSIWIASPTGLLNFDPVQEIFHNLLSGKNIRLVKEDYRGNLWIALNNSSGRGLFKLLNNKMIEIKDELGNRFPYLVNEIIEYDDSTLWLCTGDIGVIAKVNTITNKYVIAKDINTTLNAIYKDENGLLWIGTREAGLFSYDPFNNEIVDHFKSDFNDQYNLSGNTILDIVGGKDNAIWIGTNIGLNKFDKAKQRFEHITELNGLPHNWVYKIFKDHEGDLWLNTQKGISEYEESSKSIKNYDVLEGIVSLDRSGVGCQTKDGDIFLVSPEGVIEFNPNDIVENSYIPNIAITKIYASGNKIPITKKIRLAYYENNLAIEFAALSYVRPEKNLYAYKLVGLNEAWTYSENNRYATYTNLEPGEYVFYAKGSNNDGVWNEAGTSVKIIILPPWWKTWWAYIFYTGLILSLVYLAWRLQINRIKNKHEFELSRFESQKLHEIDEIKSRFFANISHEFRTPLTLIMGPAKQILRKSNDEKIKTNADLIHRSAVKLNRLVDELLDISKIESGEMKLKACPVNLVSVVKSTALSFETLAERRKLDFNLNFDEEEIIIYIDRDKFDKILNNVLSNAFKFTPEGGKVEVTIKPNSRIKFGTGSRPSLGGDDTLLKVPPYGEDLGVGHELFTTDGFIVIIIRDTGIGIPQNQLDKIFDRFYQVDGSHTRMYGGSGIGLALTKELIDLHKGKIEVESEEGKGSTFRLFFPLGKLHLKPQEICEEDKLRVQVHDKEKDKDKEQPNHELENIIRNEKVNTLASENFEIQSAPSLLIVEDNADVRKYISMILENQYSIIEAEDGEEGLNKSFECIPNIIITDIMMPKMDGFEFCRKLKSDSRTSHIPVIMLTAKATTADKINGLNLGADDYILKPFEAEELKARLNNLLQQRKRLHEHFRQHGLLELDEKDITPIDKKFLEKSIAIIKAHISDASFSVETLAENMLVSRSVLQKKIDALIGESPIELIRRTRLNTAAKLIENNFGNISEVAMEVGFSNPSYFTECFKKQFGVAPSQYHSRHN